MTSNKCVSLALLPIVPIAAVALTGLVTAPRALAGTSATLATSVLEVETMHTADAHVIRSSTASGGQALKFMSTAVAMKSMVTVAASQVTVRARGDQCNGAP